MELLHGLPESLGKTNQSVSNQMQGNKAARLFVKIKNKHVSNHLQTFKLLAHVQLINCYGWWVWLWPSLQRRSGIKNGLSLYSFQLEGRFHPLKVLDGENGQLFSTLGLVKVPPNVFWEEELDSSRWWFFFFPNTQVQDAPGVAHLCHTCRFCWLSLATLKKNLTRFMWWNPTSKFIITIRLC